MSKNDLSTPTKTSPWKYVVIGPLIVAIGFGVIIGNIKENRREAIAIVSKQAPVEDELRFSKGKMGENWPFRQIEAGAVSCTDEGAIIFTSDSGKIYALNGFAKSLIKENNPGWVDSKEIHIAGKGIEFILDAGRKQCQEKTHSLK